jgi:Lon protease-like protein
VSSLLPIFPLELVLLPGVPLPLHIFEPRYKEMIAECLEQKKPFGVVRASSDGVADIGCTAEIMSVTKKYDDGRMDILTRGVERFEVIEVNEDRSFLQAEISVVQDEDGLHDKPASRRRDGDAGRALACRDRETSRGRALRPRRTRRQSFLLTRRIASARPRLQAEPALDFVGSKTSGGGSRLS